MDMDLACVSGIEYSGFSHTGWVREDNQDSIRLADGVANAETGWLFALADGMGGYAQGKRASELAVDAMFRVFYSKESRSGKQPAARLMQRGVEAANLAVCAEARKLGEQKMGTTLTAAGINGDKLCVVHVGDSRAYLIRGNQAFCLTSDHTMVGDLLRTHIITPDQVRSHTHRSILTRGVGLSLFIQPDILQIPLQQDDRLILCSDGAWSVIEDEEFASLCIDTHQMDSLCKRIVDLALERNTDDNTSVIAVRFHRLTQARRSEKSETHWFFNLLNNLMKPGPASDCPSGDLAMGEAVK